MVNEPVSAAAMDSEGHTAARAAGAQPRWVSTPEALHQAAEIWESAASLGLDTEFVRERTYYAQPGLIQISDGRHVWLVDPCALRDLAPLGRMLANPGITKILHSVGEDLEVLQQVTGELPRPLFDTQIAAALLGQPLQMRYEHLVEQELGELLPGGKARSDWLQRPLPADLQAYAAQDVAWLPLLAARLTRALAEKQRLEWLTEDCQRLLDNAERPAASAPGLRIKGLANLDDEAVYRGLRLAEWREDEAMRRNLPRGFVLRDETLLELASRNPGDVPALQQVPGLPAPVIRRNGGTLLTLLAQARPDDFQRPAVLRPIDGDARAVVRRMQQQVRVQAEALGVDPALLASKRVLVNYCLEGPPALLSGWRGAWLRFDAPGQVEDSDVPDEPATRAAD